MSSFCGIVKLLLMKTNGGMLRMNIHFDIPTYKASLKEIHVKSDEATIGTFRRFTKSDLKKTFGRHLSSTFVSNLMIQSSNSQFQFRLNNQIRAFLSNASWTIKEQGMTIGEIREQPVGRTLIVTTEQGNVEVKSTLIALREIEVNLLSEKPVAIARGKRNGSIQNPTFDLTLQPHSLTFPPVFLPLFVFCIFIKDRSNKPTSQRPCLTITLVSKSLLHSRPA